jgi:hypothetical protein
VVDDRNMGEGGGGGGEGRGGRGGGGGGHEGGFEYRSSREDAGLQEEERKAEEHGDPYAHDVRNEQAAVAANAVHEGVVRDAERHAGAGGHGLAARHAHSMAGEGREQSKDMKGKDSIGRRRQAHLQQEVGARAFVMQTHSNSGEVDQGGKVGEGVAGLVVQERHAADAVPQAQVAAVAMQDVGVESEDGVRAVDGQQHSPRRFAR